MNLTNWTWLAVPLGLVGVLGALTVFSTVRPLPVGNEIMRQWAKQATVRTGALLAGWRMLLVGTTLGLALIVWLIAGVRAAGACLIGTLSALALGYAAVRLAAASDVRVAEAAREGGARSATRVALNASSTLGLAVASFGVLGIGLLFYLELVRGRAYPVPAEILDFAEVSAGLVVGAVAVALLAHLAGVAPAGDTEAATDLAGTAGVSTDLFGSYLAAVVATVAIGAGSPVYAPIRLEAVALPIWIITAGLVAALVGAMLLPAWERRGAPVALRGMRLVSTAVFLLLVWALIVAIGWDAADPLAVPVPGLGGPFWAVLGGALVGALAGLPRGTAFTAAWLFLLLLAAGASYVLAGLYGVGLAAIGMLGTVGITGAKEALLRIARGAQHIAREAGLDREVRDIAGGIAPRGDAAAFQAGAAALATLALVAAFVAILGAEGLRWGSAGFVLGALLGIGIPVGVKFLLAWEFAGRPETGATSAAAARIRAFWADVRLRNLAVLGGGALLLPALVGLVLGTDALGGMLLGATLAAVLLALFAPDSSVPVTNTLLKLMGAVALLLAPLLARRWGLDAPLQGAREMITFMLG